MTDYMCNQSMYHTWMPSAVTGTVWAHEGLLVARYEAARERAKVERCTL